jgi:MoxR-like ATPase
MTSPRFWFPPPFQPVPQTSPQVAPAGDRVASSVYVFDKGDSIFRAVNVAGATGRPLLVDGPSGCGKSSLAHHIAWAMQWPLHFFPVTSRTQAADLLYGIDQLKRLQDAQAQQLKTIDAYINPGVLWKGFDPDGASKVSASPLPHTKTSSLSTVLPRPTEGAVILIDEIDKADPDVPNNLLVPLGSYKFPVPELDTTVYAQQIPFIILTTNNERKLSPAFLRRCVHLTLSSPDEDLLIETGKAHQAAPELTLKAVAKVFIPAKRRDVSVSIAEYLDAVRACNTLSIDPESDDWKWVQNIVIGRTDRGSGLL